MSFQFPLGFLALLGIPVLIIIYIIKNRYTEQVISSTYIWTLSEKFLKRRNPISRLAGIVSLILQILIVIVVTLAIVHPVFTVRNSANDFCYILDGSGSMNISYNDKTRLESGKEEIRKLINGTLKGSSYTILYASGETPEYICGTTDKDSALRYLEEIQPAYNEVSDSVALNTAQQYFDENKSLKIYYITDVSYEEVENVEVINVAKDEQNYAVSNLNVSLNKNAKTLAVSADAVSYQSDASLDVALYVDGSSTPAKTQKIALRKGETTAFSFEAVEDIEKYEQVKVSILNGDGLALDSTAIIYSVDTANEHSVLIVSDPHENGSEPAFFLSKMFGAMGNLVDSEGTPGCDIVGTKEYSSEMTGYELYVFDGYMPAELPKNGATWFVNPTANLEGTNFTYQGNASPGIAGLLSWTNDTSSSLNPIFKDIDRKNPDDIYVANYVKCGITRDFDIILTHDKNPVVFTGKNVYGNSETVFAFDMNDAGVLVGDFLTLMRNLINASFPAVITETAFTCGDVMDINVLADCDSITVTSPAGKIKSLDTDSSVTSYTFGEVGIHTVTVKYVNGESKQYSVYSGLPEEERVPTVTAQSFVVEGEPQDGYRDGTYDDLLYLFITIAVLAMADWMVYCYEQYQLR